MGDFFNLNDEFSLAGEWYVPAQPEIKRKQGTLFFEPGKLIRLKITEFQGLSNERFRLVGQFTQDSYHVIKGHTENGQSVLLLENQTIASNVFYPSFVFISDQEIPWNEPEEISFKCLTARFSHLENWRRNTPFKEGLIEYDEQGHLKIYAAEYMAPLPLIASLKSIDAEIRFVPYFKANYSLNEASMEYQLFAEIVAYKNETFRWLYKQLQHLQDMLAILVNEPVRKLEISAILDNSETGIKQKIHIFHRVPTLQVPQEVFPSHMITADDLENDLSAVIDAWFRPELAEIWDTIRDIYFGVLYKAIEVPRFQLLALTQVLESYHRLKDGGEYMSQEKWEENVWQKLIGAIPSNLEESHKASIKSRTKYLYQYSLKKRVELLVQKLDKELQEVLEIRKEKKDTYIDRIVQTRNYFTHPDPEDKPSIFNDLELRQANKRLAHLLVALILQEELKLPTKLVLELMKSRKDHGLL